MIYIIHGGSTTRSLDLRRKVRSDLFSLPVETAPALSDIRLSYGTMVSNCSRRLNWMFIFHPVNRVIAKGILQKSRGFLLVKI